MIEVNIPCENCNHKTVCENTFDPYYYSKCVYYEEPRPHGKWVETDDDLKISDYRCSVCGQLTDLDEPWNFCPNCGADMRKRGEAREE